jgi:glc operon protein GlcG
MRPGDYHSIERQAMYCSNCPDKLECPMRTKPCLTSADVKRMMAACAAEAEKNQWKVAIAIVDDGGFLLHLDRMDGAAVTTAEVATGKARTSALTRRPSKDFEERVKERPAFLMFPAGLLVQGAVPIIYDSECVGAIGVSGVQSFEDEQIARAGVAALK